MTSIMYKCYEVSFPLIVWISAHPADVPYCGYLADRSGYAVAALVLLSHLAGLTLALLAELLVQGVPAMNLASLGTESVSFRSHGAVRNEMMSRDGLPQFVLYIDLPYLLRSRSRVSYLPE